MGAAGTGLLTSLATLISWLNLWGSKTRTRNCPALLTTRQGRGLSCEHNLPDFRDLQRYCFIPAYGIYLKRISKSVGRAGAPSPLKLGALHIKDRNRRPAYGT